MEYLPPPLSCHISLDNYFPSSCLLTHLAVKNIRASGALNKNRLYKYTIIGDKQQPKRLSGGFEYHTSSKRNSSAFTVVGWNGNRVHKQPPRDVPSKRRSKNMQQICRRTPMPKCSFNKVALQLY